MSSRRTGVGGISAPKYVTVRPDSLRVKVRQLWAFLQKRFVPPWPLCITTGQLRVSGCRRGDIFPDLGNLAQELKVELNSGSQRKMIAAPQASNLSNWEGFVTLTRTRIA